MSFHELLEAMEVEVTHLFALVSEDLVRATDAFAEYAPDVVAVLKDRDLVIDALYKELERMAGVQIGLQAPLSIDLRFLLSVLHVVPELERSHDLVVHIAEHATRLRRDDLSPRSLELVRDMGSLGAQMWRQAADAWYQRDGTVADALEISDDEMDGMHLALTQELASGRLALPVAMDMTLVARYYERLGDHSVNIARRVVYLAGPPRRSR